jgi:hypothetical protein
MARDIEVLARMDVPASRAPVFDMSRWEQATWDKVEAARARYGPGSPQFAAALGAWSAVHDAWLDSFRAALEDFSHRLDGRETR